MSMLDVAIKRWESEVEKQEIELIEKGVPPAAAKIDAITIVSNKRKKEYADKRAI